MTPAERIIALIGIVVVLLVTLIAIGVAGRACREQRPGVAYFTRMGCAQCCTTQSGALPDGMR